MGLRPTVLTALLLALCPWRSTLAAVPPVMMAPALPTPRLLLPAAPAPGPLFGDRGQWLLAGHTWGALYGQLKDGGGFAGRPGLHLLLSPEFAYFFWRHLALGVFSDFEYALQDGISTVAYALGPLIVGHVPIQPRWSLLPSFRGGYRYQYGLHRADMAVHFNFAYALAPHVELLLGPYVRQDVYANDGAQRVTVFGLTFGALGWL